MALRGYTGPGIQPKAPLPHGNNQQTPAVQHLIGTVYGGFGAAPRSGGALGSRKRANRKAAKPAASKARMSQRKNASKSASGRKKGAGALKKGSAAAKAWGKKMAKLRR